MLVQVSRELWLPDRSLKFGAASTDVVSITNASSISGLHPYSVAMWFFRSAQSSVADRLFDKDVNSKNMNIGGNSNKLGNGFIRSGGSPGYTAIEGMFSMFQWTFVMQVVNAGNAAGQLIRNYVGTIYEPCREVIWESTSDAGSGNPTESNGALLIGNRNSNDRVFHGNIAFFGYYAAELTLAQGEWIRQNCALFPGCRVHMLLGDTNTGTQFDLSGNGNNGTVTGATLAEGPALHFYKSMASRRGAWLFTSSLSGAITPDGAIDKQAQKSLSGEASPSGSVAKSASRALDGSTTPSGTLSRSAQMVFASSISMVGDIVRSAAKVLAGTLEPSGALSTIKAVLVSFSGAITPAATVTWMITKTLAGSLSPAGDVIKSVAHTLTGAVAPAGTATKRLFLSVAGAIGAAGIAALQSVVGGIFQPDIVLQLAIHRTARIASSALARTARIATDIKRRIAFTLNITKDE